MESPIKMDDLGGKKPTIFGNTHYLIHVCPSGSRYNPLLIVNTQPFKVVNTHETIDSTLGLNLVHHGSKGVGLRLGSSKVLPYHT